MTHPRLSSYSPSLCLPPIELMGRNSPRWPPIGLPRGQAVSRLITGLSQPAEVETGGTTGASPGWAIVRVGEQEAGRRLCQRTARPIDRRSLSPGTARQRPRRLSPSLTFRASRWDASATPQTRSTGRRQREEWPEALAHRLKSQSQEDFPSGTKPGRRISRSALTLIPRSRGRTTCRRWRKDGVPSWNSPPRSSTLTGI